MYFATGWIDFVSALAMIVVLTIAYGNMRRWLYSKQTGQMLLGVVFGGVAFVQMHMPLQPMDGLIIDLRNVPLVLCGAFLGWRAGLICLVIAVGTRYEIGGIGMYAGILAMFVALGAGALWARFTNSIARRRPGHMVLLSLLASSHLGAAIILPEPAQSWFISNAALPILLLNVFSITIAASLLDLEQRKIAHEDRHAASRPVLALNADQVLNEAQLQSGIRRLVSVYSSEFSGNISKAMSVDTGLIPRCIGEPVDCAAQAAASRLASNPSQVTLKRAQSCVNERLVRETTEPARQTGQQMQPNLDGLFGRAAFLMAPKSA